MTAWKTFALRTTIAGAVMMAAGFAGVRLALGDPGGATSPNLTFSGVLRNTDGALPTASRTAMLTFAFTKTGGGSCTPAPVSATIAAGGGFSVLVPLSSCPAFFDGADVTYTVSEGATMLTSAPVAITPVPYARYADQVGVGNDCPAGYTREPATGITLCVRTIYGGRDEVVKVGTGASAVWVDRYEARVFDSVGTQYGATTNNYPNLAANGQWTAMRGSLMALSREGGLPSEYVTWFQAAALCRSAGKNLLNRDEWFAAADGLVALDPSDFLPGTMTGETRCNTGGNITRQTGRGTGCASSWGVQDMIGNAAEWTDEWYTSVGMVTSSAVTMDGASVEGRRVNRERGVWGAAYGGDMTWNISSVVDNSGEPGQMGIPGAAIRGGDMGTGPGAGVYSLSLWAGPSRASNGTGFRCVVRR